jgi:signal transduction histidine kinase
MAKDSGPRRALRKINDSSLIGLTLFGWSFIAWPLGYLPYLYLPELTPIPISGTGLLLGMALGNLTFILFLLFAKFSYLRANYPKRHPWVMVVTLILGSILGEAAAVQTVSSLGFATMINLEMALARVVVLIAIAYAIQSLRLYRSELAQLAETRLSLAAASEAGKSSLALERESLSKKLHGIADSTIRKIVRSPEEAVSTLTKASEEVIRPIAYELSNRESGFSLDPIKLGKTRWLEIAQRLIERPLISPRLVALAVAIYAIRFTYGAPETEQSSLELQIGESTLALSADLMSLANSFGGLAVLFLAAFASASLAAMFSSRVLPRKNPAGNLVVQILAVVLVVLMSIALMNLGFRALGLTANRDQAGELVSWLSLPVLVSVLLVALLRAISEARASLLALAESLNLELKQELARINQQLWSQRDNHAQLLHGHFRAVLLSCALRLSQQAASGLKSPEIDAVTQKINEAVAEVLGSEPINRGTAPIFEIQKLWEGSCEISIMIDEEIEQLLDSDTALASATVRIVSEAVNNAIIHAKASWVRIELRSIGAELEVRVENQATAVSNSNKGLGSRLMDQLAPDWELAFDADAVRFRAAIPIGSLA